MCFDKLEFYGTPKLAIEGTPFATCSLLAHTWAGSSKVYKYSLNTYQHVPKGRGRVQSRIEFHLEHSTQD